VTLALRRRVARLEQRAESLGGSCTRCGSLHVRAFADLARFESEGRELCTCFCCSIWRSLAATVQLPTRPSR
jgi:hypothetical protein